MFATPVPPAASAITGRAIPTDVRREVWARDAAACAYVSPTGQRCGSTHQIEFHHIHPAGKNGPPTVDNISLRCRAHNSYAADLDYGRPFMDAARAGHQSTGEKDAQRF